MATSFALLADPTRRRLLDELRVGERSVGALVDRLAMTQPAVSKHLRALREAGLVSVRADAQRRIYRLDPDGLPSVFVSVLDAYQREPVVREVRLLEESPVVLEVERAGETDRLHLHLPLSPFPQQHFSRHLSPSSFHSFHFLISEPVLVEETATRPRCRSFTARTSLPTTP